MLTNIELPEVTTDYDLSYYIPRIEFKWFGLNPIMKGIELFFIEKFKVRYLLCTGLTSKLQLQQLLDEQNL
jgi:hypothetical protein